MAMTPALAPEWLGNKATDKLSTTPTTTTGMTFPEGRRNAALTKVGGVLRNVGLSGEQINAILQPANNTLCSPPLESGEVRSIALGMERYAAPPEDRYLYPASTAAEILADTSPVEWVIHNFIPARSSGLLFSEYDSYKSFVALDWALSVASGVPWQGEATKKGLVLYIAGEGRIRNRLDAWLRYHNVGAGTVDFLAIQVAVPLDSDAGALDVERQVLDYAEKTEARVLMIVADTVARALTKGGDRDPEAIGPFIRNLDRLKETTGAAVLGVHHVGHSEKGRPRGMSDLPAAADFAFQILNVDRERRYLEVHPHKMKDAERPEPKALRMETVALDICNNDGTPVTSLVPVAAVIAQAQHSAPTLRDNQALVFDAMRKTPAEWVTLDRLAEVLVNHRQLDGYRAREAAYRALKGLAKRGLVDLFNDQAKTR